MESVSSDAYNLDVVSNSVGTNELDVKSDVVLDTKEAKITEYGTEFEKDQKSGCVIVYERPQGSVYGMVFD